MTHVSHTAVVLCKQDRALFYRLVSEPDSQLGVHTAYLVF